MERVALLVCIMAVCGISRDYKLKRDKMKVFFMYTLRQL